MAARVDLVSAVAIMGKRATSFTGTGFGLPCDGTGVKEIPYTEAAAKFFYEAMIGLCALGDRLVMFLADDQKVKMAIEQRFNLLEYKTGGDNGSQTGV